MKDLMKASGFAILILAVMSCGLAGKLVEKGLDPSLDTKRASSLWSDVPRMDGFNDSLEDDMPIAAKLAMHAFVNLMFRGMEKGDKNDSHLKADWILFNTKVNEADIKNFYTIDRMKSEGNWSLVKGMESPCKDGKAEGFSGEACLFQKTEDGKQMGMIILAMPNDTSDKSGLQGAVYFIRAEVDAGTYDGPPKQ